MESGQTLGDEEETASLKTSLHFHSSWKKHGQKWQDLSPLDPAKPEMGSWLAPRWIEDSLTFTVVCKPCFQEYGESSGPWTRGKTSFQPCHARKHEMSQSHLAAVKKMLPCDGVEEEKICNQSQLRSALTKAWQETLKGANFSSMASDDLGSRNKCGRLTNVLGHACKAKERSLVRKAWVMALHQDTREGVLCVRYAAASFDSQTVARGILGFSHHFGTKAEDILQATQDTIVDFCTDHLGVFDDGLHEHICQAVELLDSDGAADEQKSLRLLSQLLPNARFICRDATHSARRLTSKPWAADSFLNEVMQTYILSSSSIVCTIQNSVDLRHVFGENVKEDEQAWVTTIRNLCSSKDRFDSTTKPLSRFVLTFDSVFKTAVNMSQRRHGTEAGKRANDFLRYCSCESLLQIAMLSDAACEALEVVRYHDTELFDLSQTPAELSRFLHKIDVLFLRSECLNLGHTKVMLDLLKCERNCILQPEKVYKSLGGPGAVTPEIIDRCRKRMAAWVRLAAERLDVEFPSWRPLASFQVFDLHQALQNSKGERQEATSASAKVNIDKLAEIFNLDPKKLLEEFLLLRTNALHYLETGRCSSSMDAWKLARGHLLDRRMKGQYDVNCGPSAFPVSSFQRNHNFGCGANIFCDQSWAW